MILSFFEGFLLGLGAAVPIGPINIIIMNEALKDYKKAVTIGLGAMSSDLTYITLMLLSLLTFLDDPDTLNVLKILGASFLIYLSYSIFKNRNQKIKEQKSKTNKKILWKSYLKGYILTLTSPYTVAFWLSVTLYANTKEADPYIVIAGMISAIILWVTLMPYFIYKNKHLIKQRIIYLINMISSLILFGFGISMFTTNF